MAIVIKKLHPKEGLEKGLERCWIAAQTTCRICPSLKNFLQTPVLFIEYTPNPLYLERGLQFPLLCIYTYLLSWAAVHKLSQIKQGLILFITTGPDFFLVATEQQQCDFCNYCTPAMTFDVWMSMDLGDSCRLEQLASFLRRHPELGIGTTCHTPQGSVILTLKVVTNEKGGAVGDVLTIIC